MPQEAVSRNDRNSNICSDRISVFSSIFRRVSMMNIGQPKLGL